MANARTTSSVDRRLVQHLVQAIPGTVDENAIKAHLNNAARSHLLIAELVQADPKRVNLQQFRQALLGGRAADLKVKKFASADVLVRVRSLGGQFANAQVTDVPGGETLESQRDSVIRFWTNWHWKPEEVERLQVEPSIASQVVYLPNLVEDSLGCTYDKVPESGHKSVEEVIAELPKVSGLRWIVGNTPTFNRVLANHLETGEYLLRGVYTWTTDSYQSEEYGFGRLLAGDLGLDGVHVSDMGPGRSAGRVGLFVLGVPA